MVAFRRQEAWNHTTSVIASIYQVNCAEKEKVFWPEQFHPDYEPIDEKAESVSDSRLPVGSVPQKTIFGMMKTDMSIAIPVCLPEPIFTQFP